MSANERTSTHAQHDLRAKVGSEGGEAARPKGRAVYNEGADEDTSGAAAGGEQGHGAAGCCGEQGHRWQGLQDGHGAGPGEAAAGHQRERNERTTLITV